MMRLRKGLLLLLATLLIVLTGCQAVGGVEVGTALKQLATVKSLESKGSFAIKINVAPNAKMEKEQREIVDLINSTRIETVSKVQDSNNVSVKGTAYIKDKKLGFHILVDSKQMAVHVDGAKAPIVVPFVPEGMEGFDLEDMPILSPAVQNQFQEKFVSFFVKHAPNPTVIDVKATEETVFDQKLNVNRIHAEFGANETFDWTRGLIKSVVADEAGTKAWLKDVITTFGEVMKTMDDSTEVGLLIKNSETSANLAYSWLKDNGVKAVDGVEQEWKNLLKDLPNFAPLMSKDTNMKVDWFVDSELTTHKMLSEFNIALPQDSDFPITSVQIKQSAEYRNVNKPVSVDTLDTSKALKATDSNLTPGDWLRHFDSSSDIHKFMLETGFTSKYLTLPLLEEDGYEDWGYDYPRPIVEKGKTFVPLRYVAEAFDADVKWDKSKKQIRIVDDITQKVITLKVDSKSAQVDGKAVALKNAPKLIKGTVYVPLVEVADFLNVKAKFENYEYGKFILLDRN
ncbi:copper amine oxidase N-terminal domain-containing protein [Paenibacillus sp. SC116]|uniref:copper amine oxidase N-terminal domain-containing protein n=1 Tax=Paenibacillus sp. SC116 TaxID=2968986 RepID=UPI00215AA337|nr:copper amine oxidase N-terminal domain-containing protein [Paenibacillus sp. SC116]MCR8845937.1 copper amine oxidase N-terminal domain-containing protein [Paenibacillus sp. SC116]